MLSTMLMMHLVPLGIGGALSLAGSSRSGDVTGVAHMGGMVCLILAGFVLGYIMFGKGTSEMDAATSLFFVYGIMMFLPYVVVALLFIWAGWTAGCFVQRGLWGAGG